MFDEPDHTEQQGYLMNLINFACVAVCIFRNYTASLPEGTTVEAILQQMTLDNAILCKSGACLLVSDWHYVLTRAQDETGMQVIFASVQAPAMPEDMLKRLSDLAQAIGQTGKVPEPPFPAPVIAAEGSADPPAAETALPRATHQETLTRQ